MSKNSINIGVRATPALKASLETIANKYNTSLSNLVSLVLTSFVFEYSKGLAEGFTDEDAPSIK